MTPAGSSLIQKLQSGLDRGTRAFRPPGIFRKHQQLIPDRNSVKGRTDFRGIFAQNHYYSATAGTQGCFGGEAEGFGIGVFSGKYDERVIRSGRYHVLVFLRTMSTIFIRVSESI